MNMKKAVLLVNLGTPDSPSVRDVRSYLYEFLNDPRVIDIPAIARFILVNFIIVPLRAFSSAKIYKELWEYQKNISGKAESPILIYGNSVKEKLQHSLGANFDIHLAMRYKNPALKDVLEEIKLRNYESIIIIPLFPQYASATTGSVIEKIMKIVESWWVIPKIKFINQFYNDEGFINTIVQQANKYKLDDFNHILFSYHGLPVRQVDKVYSDGKPCDDHNCENEINETNIFCYKATCYATTRLITEKLGISRKIHCLLSIEAG